MGQICGGRALPQVPPEAGDSFDGKRSNIVGPVDDQSDARGCDLFPSMYLTHPTCIHFLLTALVGFVFVGSCDNEATLLSTASG